MVHMPQFFSMESVSPTFRKVNQRILSRIPSHPDYHLDGMVHLHFLNGICTTNLWQSDLIDSEDVATISLLILIISGMKWNRYPKRLRFSMKYGTDTLYFFVFSMEYASPTFGKVTQWILKMLQLHPISS